jgi:aspartyl-tRNA(Asn)/glutamyl-tRNA(Gln) amidotransferase subunit A
MHSCLAFTFEEATIDSIHQAIQQHQVTCVQLTTAYLTRIKQYNFNTAHQAPINALSEINASALTEAARLDNEFSRTNKLSGALHCIPIILKDNIDSYDTTTTAGSYALLGNQPVKDADLTARLRHAGAVILGKGGMDEFAWGMFGFSSRTGRIGNVYNTAKNPGGSSGGSAAAVSANFATVSVGSDNSGSVRIPAVYNGLVGLRPTAKLVSQQGLFPMGNLDGAAGPMARTTTDLAMMLDVMAVPEYADKKTYRSYLNSSGLKGKRIAIVRQVGKVDPFNHISPDVQTAINHAIQLMQQQGVTFIDIKLPDFDNNREHNQAGEVEDINSYLASFPAVRKNFKDICESDRSRNFGDVKACLKFMRSVPNKNSAQYKSVVTLLNNNRKYVESVMQDNHLDALLMPLSTQAAGSYDGVAVNTWQAPLSSNAGLPAIAFMVGYDEDNMPISVDVTGAAFSEGKLIETAYAYEQLTHLRRVPTLPNPDMRLVNKSIPQINHIISEIGKATYDKLILTAKAGEKNEEVISVEKFRVIVDGVVGGVI